MAESIDAERRRYCRWRPARPWEVCDGDELDERIDCMPREATIRTLAAGGMSGEQIDAEMCDWRD